MQEECGLNVEIINEIGLVEDDYNLIHRHNESFYYLVKVIDKTKLNREFYETKWIKDMIWININDLIDVLSQPSSDIARVVYRREKIVLEKVKELI